MHFRSVLVDRSHQTIKQRQRGRAERLRIAARLQQSEVRSQMRGGDVDFVVGEVVFPVQAAREDLLAERGELFGRLQIAVDLQHQLRAGLPDLLVLVEEESEAVRERVDRKQRSDGQSGLKKSQTADGLGTERSKNVQRTSSKSVTISKVWVGASARIAPISDVHSVEMLSIARRRGR